MSRPFMRCLAILALSAGGFGCSFEAPPSEGAFTSNTCSFDEECTPDAKCMSSMCVARSIDDSMRVLLDVSPPQQTDGLPPVSTILPIFTVKSGTSNQSWTLDEPVRVRGRIRNGGTVVDADVTLTAKQTMAGIPAKIVIASVASSVADFAEEYDFDVRVAGEGEHTLRVEPKDTSLPPYEATVMIERGKVLEIDYAELDVERTLELEGDIDGRPLVVRAFDLTTGLAISSSASVVDGSAMLRFAEEPEEFRLVVRPDGAYDPEGVSSVAGCDHDTPVLPTFSINSSHLPFEDDAFHVALPAAPARVLYEGIVESCSAPSINGAAEPDRLPVTLRSTSLALGDAGEWTAELTTDTEAVRDNAVYKYCIDVFEGFYEIVVTPPESKPCEIFAQEFPIRPSDEDMTFAPTFKMQNAAELSGELRTADMMPLAATTVDVRSLGRTVDLAPGDATLTEFNRSRQTTTDAAGLFSLAVDRGSYDVTLKPPMGSGYAWYVRRDVTIGSRGDFPNFIDMSSPIAVDCHIGYDDGASLVGSEITAYAVVVDEKGVERAVAIGKAVADDTGSFMLLLPPAVHAGWTSAGLD